MRKGVDAGLAPPGEIRAYAMRFSRYAFQRRMRRAVEQVIADQQSPPRSARFSARRTPSAPPVRLP
jgi:hypothetical protein